MTVFRFWLGRALIHAGIGVMPQGRVRRELEEILWAWSDKVEAILDAGDQP